MNTRKDGGEQYSTKIAEEPRKSEMRAVVNVATDRVAHPKPNAIVVEEHWYVARVRTCCEKKAEEVLSKLGFIVWVPTQKVVRQWRDRRKIVESIVIPSLVFFRAKCKSNENTNAQFRRVKEVTYVYNILTMPGGSKPTPIPDAQIDQLKYMLFYADSPITFEEGRKFKKGDKVVVVRGKLKGFKGLVHQEPDGRTHLFVAVDFLGCATMEISAEDVKYDKETE